MCVREREIKREKEREKTMYDTREKIHHPQSYMWGRKKRKAGGWGGVGEGTAGAKRKTERENEKLERETELIVIAVALREIVGIIIIINTIIAVCTKRSLFFHFFFFSTTFSCGGNANLSLFISLLPQNSCSYNINPIGLNFW